jgi:hypothetical protein
MSNVVEFPKSAIVRDTASQTAERLTALKDRSTRNFADSMMHEMLEDISMAMDACGIDTETREFQRDYIFLSSILHAMIYRAVDLPHKMHDFIENHVSLVEIDPDEVEPQGELQFDDEVPPPGSTS